MRTLLLYPFLYLTSGIVRKSNKIGGFVVKGNPKIQIQYFQFHGLATIPNKVNIYLHTCNCADRVLSSAFSILLSMYKIRHHLRRNSAEHEIF